MIIKRLQKNILISYILLSLFFYIRHLEFTLEVQMLRAGGQRGIIVNILRARGINVESAFPPSSKEYLPGVYSIETRRSCFRADSRIWECTTVLNCGHCMEGGRERASEGGREGGLIEAVVGGRKKGWQGGGRE